MEEIYIFRIVIIILLFSNYNKLSPIELDDIEDEYIIIELESMTTSDLEEFLNRIEYYSNNPLSLKNLTLSNLLELPTISLDLANEIISYIDTNKNRTTVYKIINELNTSRLQTYVLSSCISDTDIEDEFYLNYRSRNRNLLNKTNSDVNNSFEGSNLDLYQRLNMTYNNINANIIIDKDRGERKITDFNSFNIDYRKGNFRVLAGDFKLNSGLGLIYNMNFRPTKTSFLFSPQSFGNGLQANTSTIENLRFRGIAASYLIDISKKDLEIRAFYSNINRSSTIDNDTAFSINKTGLYRTESEILRKSNLNEKLFGINPELRGKNYGLGFNISSFNYNHEIYTNSLSDFRGRQGLMKSIYGYYFLSNSSINSEIAFDFFNNAAFNFNYNYNIRKLKLFFTARYFSPDYRSQFAGGISEQSFMSNEYGILSSLRYKLNKSDYIMLYADIYSSIKKNNTLMKPLKGVEIFVEYRKRLNKKTFIDIRFINENKYQNFSIDGLNSKYTELNNKYRARIDFSYQLLKELQVKTRLEVSKVDLPFQSNETGFLASIQCNYDFLEQHSLNFRYSIFNTDSFNSAIYGFMFLMPGYSFIYPFNGRGVSILGRYRVNFLEYLRFYCALEYLNRADLNEIGSGFTKIMGNRRANLFFQFEFII